MRSPSYPQLTPSMPKALLCALPWADKEVLFLPTRSYASHPQAACVYPMRRYKAIS